MTGLRFGILGTADIAARRTVPALLAEGHTVAVVASRDRARADAFARRFGGQTVAGYADLVRREDLDAVYVPLPVALHHQWAAAALRAGKHVLVEKSAVTDPDQARTLVKLAQAADRLVMENFTFLTHPQHAALRRLISQGGIGEPRVVTAEFGIPPADPTGIRYQPGLGGGSLRETGCYPVRLAWSLLDPASTTVAGAVLTGDGGVDTAGSVLLRDRSGRTAHCAFGFTHAYRNACAVWGSTGRATLSWPFTAPPHHRPVLRVERQDRVEEHTLPAADQFRTTLRRFAALATGVSEVDAEGRPVESTVDGRAAEHAALVRQAELLAGIEAAARG